jgi:hypothetical protein
VIDAATAELLFDILSIIIMLVLLVLFVIDRISKGRPAAEIDAELAARLKDMRGDREHMLLLERQYEAANSAFRMAFDMFTGVLGIVDRIIPGNADTALKNLLEDIQKPGPSADIPAPLTPQVAPPPVVDDWKPKVLDRTFTSNSDPHIPGVIGADGKIRFDPPAPPSPTPSHPDHG